MYIIISDSRFVNDDSRYYYFSTGEYYNQLIQNAPELLAIKREAVDEVLFYSFAGVDNDKAIRIAKCLSYECGDGHIKIVCTDVRNGEATCGEVKRRLYGYCVKNQLLVNEKTPFVITVDSIQQYTNIKVGKSAPRYVSLMEKEEAYRQQNNWEGIVELFPSEKEIKNSEYWDDDECLSKLAFALGKVASKCRKERRESAIRQIRYNPDSFFLLVSNRCLELNPESSMHQSTRAYYYYELYMDKKTEEAYQKASEIYMMLTLTSKEKYKEEYRYTKLRQMHFENNQWNGVYADDWLFASRKILESYKRLIDTYIDLDEDRKSKYRTLYLRSLFGYSSFSLDMYFTYWDDYVQQQLFGRELKPYKLEQHRLREIAMVEKYLTQLLDEGEYTDSSHIDLQAKPNYFEVMYRLAQIEQVEGIVYVMLGKEPSEYNKFFVSSNEHIDTLLSAAKEQKSKGKRFNFPHYAKLPKAINLYFLGLLDECHKCFFHAREYMIYEQGRIYALCHDYEKANQVLSLIPSSDKCYHKAQKLIAQIQESKYEN